jgi:hypothetical protein
MLVILSDLHLTDGSTGATISPGAFSVFAQRMKDMAVAASWRTDGNYRPIECIDLVLLGDVLDVIRSSRWASLPTVRPWGDPHAPELADQIARITDDILRHNDQALGALRALAAPGGVTVPPMFRTRSRPAAEEDGQPVPVRIHYMVGNHDWFYHLPGPHYDVLRRKVAEAMGLGGRHDQPFPHDISESGELLQTMRRHKVTARHGDLFDPLNFEGDRDASSLGDVIVIELIGRFAAEVEHRLAEELPAATLAGLREIDNVRPLMMVPVWIDGLLERTCSFPSMRKRVKAIWDRLADEFLATVDMVDGLEQALKFSKRLSIGWTSAIAGWLNRIRGAASASYYHHALAEQDFRNRRARHIVYGHTHAVETVPLDASYAEGYVLNQVYFNAGTWRRVHRPTQLATAEHEFIAHDEMSYLAFFHGDERSGRPYETWSGTLGFHPAQTTVHRIDPGRASHGAGRVIPTSTLHTHAPHFATPPAASRSTPARRV